MPAGPEVRDAPEDRARFELRQCGDGPVEVFAYSKKQTRPALEFNTGDAYVAYLVHAGSVLVLQSSGGSSDHVYVFAFRAGRPIIALQTATKDLIQVKQTGEGLTVTVPPTSYPVDPRFPPQPPPREYSFSFDR
jgi:hypothetical protein